MLQYVYKVRRGGKADRCWRGRYRLDRVGRVYSVALHTTDRRVALRRLAALVVEAQRVGVGLATSQRPVLALVDEFVGNVAALGRVPLYVANLRGRLQTMVRACQWQTVGQITRASFETWRRGQVHLSAKTLNEYLAALRSWVKWLVDTQVLASNALASVPKVDGRGKERVVRRALSDDECRRLLGVALARGPVYLMAIETGLRRAELAALRWTDLELAGARPCVHVRASTAKNRRDAVLPLSAGLVAMLRGTAGHWIGEGVVFGAVPSMAEFYGDLERAGIARLDGQGRRVDFHALRHTCATRLHAAGVSQRYAMELMRHSDARLTNKTYTDSSQLHLAAEVAKVPALLGKRARGGAQAGALLRDGAAGPGGPAVVAGSWRKSRVGKR